MEERIESRFAELVQADGFSAWYESEEHWEDYEKQMVQEGLDAEMVHDFFCEMAWDL